MIVIPIGHESNEVRRLPWVTFGIMGLCIILHIFLSIQVSSKQKGLESAAEEMIVYYFNHPYLELNPEVKNLMYQGGGEESVETMLSVYRQSIPRPDRLVMAQEQEKLDGLSQNLLSALNDFPYRKWGFIPADKSFFALLTYMFVHGGWLHLLGNLLLLYLTGPFIEDLWGRPVFAAFYLTMGVLSALMYASHYPNFTGPLIGASGAIAGVMGAFLINFWKTKMRFFYWIAFFFRGTFEAPAFVMLPLWVLLEFFNASMVDSVNAQGGGGGVAHWAHVWGFVFGVLVALGMRHLKIEEKYIHPKLEAKLESQEGAVDVVITALQKKSLGRIDEAYGLLLEEAHKNPFRSDVVDALWDIGLETGHGEEAAKFFIKLIESEVRHDRMEVAWNRYKDLRAKVTQASIHPTYKFALLKFLIQSRDIEEANQLASELLQKLDVKSPPVLLQNFAHIAKELGPSVAKKALDLCLQHPEIPDESKETMKKELTSSESDFKAPSAQRDEDLSVEPA